MVRVRLTRKLADQLNGVDVSAVNVGDHIVVANAVAAMLIREGWAELVDEGVSSTSAATAPRSASS